ncbi:MAG TPA: FxLYD domain-containing protein, partial [Chitinophagaceae bacterium]|nr:FxLYD domain-containing protein [Chitinophagaceae bacterium]
NVQPQPDQIVAENEQANEQTLPANNKNETADESINVRNANSPEKPGTNINRIPLTKKSQVSNNTNKSAAIKSSFQKQQKKPIKDFIAQINPDDIALDKNQEEIKPVVSTSKNQDHSSALTHFKTEPKITDYIAVDTYTPSPASAVGVKLRIQNISDIPVDMVMVDLQYYDTNGRYQTGATVYVRNISAGQTVTIPAPDNNLASKVNYRISMVSSETNNLYLTAD